MAQQTINIGAAPNDGTGDVPRTAGSKINSNFDELYAKDASLDGDILDLNSDLAAARNAAAQKATAGGIVNSSYITGNKTLVETPAALFAGGSQLTDRINLTVRNESVDTRLRVGRLQANLQRDGIIVEPQSILVLSLTDATTIYGCSEGGSIKTLITEVA